MTFAVVTQLTHLAAVRLTLAYVAPGPMTILVVVPIMALVCFLAGAVVWWASYRLKQQQKETVQLSHDLEEMKSETRRRLNFLNAISHDLRTPLNGVTLQTHVIENALATRDDVKIAQAVSQIRASSSLAADVLDSLLQYAQIDLQENRVVELRLKDVLTQMSDPFRAAAEEKGLTFALQMKDDLTVTTDREKIQRILANIMENAIKFTPVGSITVNLTLADNTHASIEVVDTGSGIPISDHAKLFREFYQRENPSRDARLGLGLGLVVAHRLTEQLNGKLTFESSLDKGTCFRLMLPITPTADHAQPSAPLLKAASPTK